MFVSPHHLSLLLRTTFILILQVSSTVAQPPPPPPPNYFFNCSENLLVSSIGDDGKVALFNLNTNTATNVKDISDPPSLQYLQAAIDDVSGALYIRFGEFQMDDSILFFNWARFNTTNSDLLPVEPFVLDSGQVLSGHEFVDGDIYYVAGEPPRLVQAQVNETANSQGDATLSILDNSVVDLSDNGSIAWDSCKLTMYFTSQSNPPVLRSIDIFTGDATDFVGTTFEGDDGTVSQVLFRDITVGPGPDCVLYGVIDLLVEPPDNLLNSTLRGWVAMIDPNTGGVTPLADTKVDGEFDDAFGIASCSNPPLPVTPPDNKCYVDLYYPSKMYDSKSFLEGWYYDLGDICTHGFGGGHDDSQHAGANEQQELAATTPSTSSSSLLRASGGASNVCCYTNTDDAYKNKKTIIGGDGESPNCVMCNACSMPQEVNDHCCSQARRRHGHYGGCKAKMGNDYVCCKCANGYTCAHKISDCTTACNHLGHE